MCDIMNTQALIIITDKDIHDVLLHFSKKTYWAGNVDHFSNGVLQKCVELMKKDYSVYLINNNSGELSSSYPSQLIMLEYENGTVPVVHSGSQGAQRTTNTIYEYAHDVQNLRDLFESARVARCRARFPMPVILYKGKFICRSGTLSGGVEIFGRCGFEAVWPAEDKDMDSCGNTAKRQVHDVARGRDIKLLQNLNVATIVDFMVENKKVKFGVNITSSEKVDKENRYSDFNIISLPYPGCEFFKEFKDNNYSAEGLIFDWSQGYVDAKIRVPNNSITSQLNIEWNDYENWDLIVITQNYMRLILKYVQDSNAGLLIHCISGWDRTPLFISLIRLSLWADGLIHQGLDEHQMLYLTIAYDWMLFAHHLPDRLSKGEDIFFFCFYMLKYISSDDFSIGGWMRHKSGKFSDRSSDRSDRSSSERSDKSDRSDRSDKNDKSVFRADSDLHLDGMLMDQDSRGSNISLNSASSTQSRDSQEQSLIFNFSDESSNGNTYPSDMASPVVWSAQGKRTSPVTVPLASRVRQRQESTSSLSTGSWQMITGTGSLRSSDSNTTLDTDGANANRYDGHSSQDSSCTLIDDDFCVNGSPSGYSLRKERLLKVRELFYSSYYATINSNIKYVSDTSLVGGLVGTLMEKAGFSQGNLE